MSAISYYAGYAWSDHPECVDPVIRALCVRLNDALPSDAERGRIIGPHLLAPLGTAQGTEMTIARAFVCADTAVRVCAPRALDAAGMPAEAQKLRDLPEISSAETARDAANAAYAADTVHAANAAYAADTVHAANAAYYAADTAQVAVARVAASAAAAHYIAAAHEAAADAHEAAEDILALILRLCAMGSRVEVPQVRDLSELPQ